MNAQRVQGCGGAGEGQGSISGVRGKDMQGKKVGGAPDGQLMWGYRS